MAAVEKRKSPALALLGNHLMFAVISIFIVLGMDRGGFMNFFGIFFLILYLFGIYDYSNRDGIEHTKSYSTVKPSFKHPVIHGLIANCYFLVPIIACHFFINTGEVLLFAFFFDAQFMFSNILTVESLSINWLTAGIFTLIIFTVPILGYFAGMKGFRIAAVLSKYLYVRKKK